MPRKTTRKTRRRRQSGKGFMDFIKKVGSFLHKSKLISTVGNALGTAFPIAGSIGRAASAVGFGSRRRLVHTKIARRKLGRGTTLAGAGAKARRYGYRHRR